MPLYVYEPTVYTADSPVSDCCYFESLQSLSEQAHTVCSTCGHPVHRAVTACGPIRTRDVRANAKKDSPRGQISDGLKERLKDILGRDFGPTRIEEGRHEEYNRTSLPSPLGDTPAGKTARLIANHICTTICRH